MHEMLQQAMRNPQSLDTASNPWSATGSRPSTSLLPNPWTTAANANEMTASGGSMNGNDASLSEARALSNRQTTASWNRPHARFPRQLQSLLDMGFDDEERNIRALNAVGGNVNRAVEWLLLHPVDSVESESASPGGMSTVSDEADDDADQNESVVQSKEGTGNP